MKIYPAIDIRDGKCVRLMQENCSVPQNTAIR